MGDLRRAGRTPYSGKVNLNWASENGDPCARNGECLDVSSSGLKIKVDAPIATRTVVTVRARELELHGSASVRSCTRAGAKFIIGLEFVGGMKWRIPASMASTSGSQ